VARPHASRRDAFALSEAQPVTTLVEQAHIELHYNYEQLPAAQRARAIQAAQAIKPRLKRAAEDIFVIGAELNQVKASFPHGEFGNWLGTEFGLSQRMAQHFMNVATRLLDKSEKFSHLPPSSLYLLAAPTTPDLAIIEVEQKLDAGARLRIAEVTLIVESARMLAQPLPEFPPLDADARHRGQRLARRLEDTLQRLEGYTVKDWSVVVGDRRLSHVRRLLTEMLEDVQTLVFSPAAREAAARAAAAAAATDDPTDDADAHPIDG